MPPARSRPRPWINIRCPRPVSARASSCGRVTGPFELRVGADWRETEGRTQELFQFVAGAPTRGRVAGGRTRTIGGFAEAGWEHGDLTLSGGGRLDRWWIEQGSLHERFLATGATITDAHFPDRGGWEATGRAGLAWRPAEIFTLRTAAYLGWRLPTLNELYRPFRVGADATAANAALAPERVEGVEAGFDLRPTEGARIGITLFANRLEDAISNVTLGMGPGVFPGVGFVAAGGQFRQRQNVEAIVSRGVEVDAALAFGRMASQRRLQLRRRRGPCRRDGAAARRSAAGPGAAPQRLGHPRLGGREWRARLADRALRRRPV